MQTKLKKKPLIILMAVFVIAFFLLIVAGWLYNDYLLSTPVNKQDASTQLITIEQGAKTETIADQLAGKKLIRSAFAFGLYARLSSVKGHLQAGVYEFSPSQSAKQMAKEMHDGHFATRRIVIPEGLNSVAIAKAVERSGFVNKAEFLKALTESHTNATLSYRPAGSSSLEGLLAPGTYTPLVNSSATALVNQMLTKFSTDTESFRARTAPQGLTFYQAVTLASLVELEAPHTEDRRKIAGVFLNRLKAGMKLQSDTTTFYINTLKANNLVDNVYADTKLNSYKMVGLPAQPIASPSLDSLEAVYNPQPSNNLYFIASKDGTVYYASDYATHLENINKYMN